jgi:hypothetical protein
MYLVVYPNRPHTNHAQATTIPVIARIEKNDCARFRKSNLKHDAWRMIWILLDAPGFAWFDFDRGISCRCGLVRDDILLQRLDLGLIERLALE